MSEAKERIFHNKLFFKTRDYANNDKVAKYIIIPFDGREQLNNPFPPTVETILLEIKACIPLAPWLVTVKGRQGNAMNDWRFRTDNLLMIHQLIQQPSLAK